MYEPYNKKKFEYKQYSLSFKIDPDIPMSEMDQHWFGKHRGWHGRPYRRGKNRCLYCGAPLTAPNDPDWIKKQRDNLIIESLNNGFSRDASG